MGGRGLSQVSFGNGQNHNMDFSQRNRGASGRITCQQNGNGQKQTCYFFSFFCRRVVAIVLTLITVALIQAKNCTRHIRGFALTQGGSRLVRASTCSTCISKLPEDRHHVVRRKLERFGVGFAFGVLQCIPVYIWMRFVVIKSERWGRRLQPICKLN